MLLLEANNGTVPENNHAFLAAAEQKSDVQPRYIGEISGFAGGIAIPAASANLTEAGYRYDAKEQYSEPPVEVGEIDNQAELMKIFADKPYKVDVHFKYDNEYDELVPYEHEDTFPGERAIDHYSVGELRKIAELMKPNIHKILDDFKRFKGRGVKPYSLVDELNEREEIDFDEDSRDSRHEPEFIPKLLIELRGGMYGVSIEDRDEDSSNFYFHRDGLRDGIGTAYTGSFVEPGQEPLPTHFVPGVYKADEKGETSVDFRNGGKKFGIDSITSDNGKLYRVSTLIDTSHSAPIEPVVPQLRVFMRAGVQ